jgi:hypothetical protein
MDTFNKELHDIGFISQNIESHKRKLEKGSRLPTFSQERAAKELMGAFLRTDGKA